MLPNDVPSWPVVQQQTQRWIKAGCFERLAHDLREVLRVAAGREAQPTAVILASRTVQSTPSSGARAGYDGAMAAQAAAASPATTNASPLPSLVSTGSPSPASGSAASSTQVHDSL